MKKNRLNRKPVFFLLLLCLTAGEPIFADEFQITPLKPLFDLEAEFLQPSDVAVGKNRLIYIMDGVNHCVKVFDDKGSFVFKFGGKGSGSGLFNSPLGITTDKKGRVYVADTGNRRIQVFSARGEYQTSFRVKPGKQALPSDPVDLAVDETRQRLYVVDNDNHCVVLYSLNDFRFLNRWGSEGEGMQEFNHPFFIAVGSDTSVFVVDVLNARVQVWSPKGEAVGSIGDYGVDIGQLYRPKGVCVDRDNNVFVSDSYVGAIQIFNKYGHLKSVAGTRDGKIIKWKTPVGITIDDSQRLYVVEMLLNRVRVYQILTPNKKE